MIRIISISFALLLFFGGLAPSASAAVCEGANQCSTGTECGCASGAFDDTCAPTSVGACWHVSLVCQDDDYCREMAGANFTCHLGSHSCMQNAPPPVARDGEQCDFRYSNCEPPLRCVRINETRGVCQLPPPATEVGNENTGATESAVSNNEGLINALQADSLEDLITDILDALVQLGAIFIVLALVWVGFLFAGAQGNEEKIKTAREALFWCVIGGLLLLGASAISLAIKGFVGAL